jgi:DNA-directed RNA polymerase specialized sigma24 family protein
MRRPARTTLDPAVLESGDIGRQTANVDEYFDGGVEPTLRIVVHHFLAQLEEPQRTAVEMCIMKRMTYKEAAEWFTLERRVKTDPKTVWRWAQQGIERLGMMFRNAKWANAIEPRILDGKAEG